MENKSLGERQYESVTCEVGSRPLSKRELFSELARYPDPPPPFGCPFKLDIPPIKAIYFLYQDSRIEYVGKSQDLSQRLGPVKIFRHHALEDGDMVSWIEFEEEKTLEFVECYYIWLCRPGRNFGRKDECFDRRMLSRRNLKQ